MGWRSKFVFFLLIYFAGFATAVYHMGPQPAQADRQVTQKSESGKSSGKFSVPSMDLNSERILKSLNISAKEFASLTKQASIKAADFIKLKIEQARESKKFGKQTQKYEEQTQTAWK